MSNIYAKAYTEVYEILKNIPDEDFNKIPEEVLHMLEIKRDIEYRFKLQENVEFENQNLLRETKILLAILYRDYWATKEEKDRIISKWKNDIKIAEEKKKEVCNIDIFEKEKIEENNKKMSVEVKKEKIFKKLINYITKLFQK